MEEDDGKRREWQEQIAEQIDTLHPQADNYKKYQCITSNNYLKTNCKETE